MFHCFVLFCFFGKPSFTAKALFPYKLTGTFLPWEVLAKFQSPANTLGSTMVPGTMKQPQGSIQPGTGWSPIRTASVSLLGTIVPSDCYHYKGQPRLLLVLLLLAVAEVAVHHHHHHYHHRVVVAGENSKCLVRDVSEDRTIRAFPVSTNNRPNQTR